MPRTAEQFEEMRQESRDRILAAALELFARRGYAAATVREIATAAGVSQGLLYNYFDGKADLLRSIVRKEMADVYTSFEESARGGTVGERLERLIRSALRIVAENRDFWRLSYQIRWQPEVLELVGAESPARSATIRQRIADLLEEDSGRPLDVEVRALVAAIDGAAQHMVLEPESYPVEEVARELAARFRPARSGVDEEDDDDAEGGSS